MTGKKGSSKSLFHPRIWTAATELVDSENSVSVEIVKGKCPNTISLYSSQFPPNKLHQSNVPISVTVKLDARTAQTFDIDLMVRCVEGDCNDVIIIGIMAQDQVDALFTKYGKPNNINTKSFLVGIKYSPVTRKGTVYLYKDLHKLMLLEKGGVLTTYDVVVNLKKVAENVSTFKEAFLILDKGVDDLIKDGISLSFSEATNWIKHVQYEIIELSRKKAMEIACDVGLMNGDTYGINHDWGGRKLESAAAALIVRRHGQE